MKKLINLFVPWLKNKYLYIVAGALAIFFYLKSTILRQERDKVKIEKLERREAVRERAREADEKINSSPSAVADWLHKHNKFRD